MKSSEYWAKREAEALKHRITDEKEYDRQIKKIYAEMIDNCQKEINSFYVKYANAEDISLAEAKKRVSKLDIAAYERKAARYVKDKDFSKQANEEMRLYNATMKINRLEMLKANLGLELISGHNELEKFMGGILQGRTEDELARQAGILGKTIKNPAENAEAIINASFHNANFSDRIWLYQDVMKADLEKLLKTGIIQGKNPNVLARELNKRFDVGRANAERLMRTELARVQTEAQRQSFERDDIKEFMFIVNSNCCDICQAIDGKHFKVKDMLVGENAPPLHPNCRCSIAAYEDTTEFDAWLDHLGDGGTMTWEDFKAQPKEKLTNNVKSDIIASGARILNPYSEEGDKFAKSYYAEVKSFSTDTSKIAKNTGYNIKDIEKIKKYLFYTPSFKPDCAIAHSWQRLMLGKGIKEHDYLLLKHELYEMQIKKENPNIPHIEAHTKATHKYNYQKAVDEYYGNLKKRNKNR